MDIDRSHFRTTSSGSTTAAAATSELFICFTSRLSSSSSMKLSKSILSPGRAARDGVPTTLSSSLSRRLRTNGSLKAGQASPFFTTTGKKRGCAFDNPEPSSPKVTCIGQVRVKTKKKVKQTRSLSKRRSGGGEVSFRKVEQSTSGDGDDKGSTQQQRYSNASAHYPPPQECLPHRNQRWVHLPISICEALRTFGAEFSCLFPCRSSCFSTAERERMEKQNDGENGCGAVFRWLVAVNEGEGGKSREIELVVGGGDEEEETVSMRSSRRHVFEDIEVKDGNRIELKGRSLEREEEEEAAAAAAAGGRVGICIPPKNALLLMRCRSDPMKMAALVNRSSTKNQTQDIPEEEETQEEEEIMADGAEQCVGSKDESFDPDIVDSEENTQIKYEVLEVEDNKLETERDGKETEEAELEISSEEMVQEKTEILVLEIQESSVEEEEGEEEDEEVGEEEEEEEEEEVESNMSSFEDLLEQENAEQFEEDDDERVEEEVTPVCHLSPSSESDEEKHLQSNESPPLLLQESAMENIRQDSVLLDNEEENHEAEVTPDDDEEDEEEETELAAAMAKPEETQELIVTNNEVAEKKEEAKGPLLPECLLLMMCEPKLSMEVSKETWVCSTDFTRWLPERPRRPAAKPRDGDLAKRRLSIDSKPKPAVEKNRELHQPPRSSCSLPVATAAAASMATMLEQKLVNAVGYEPFVLTRCKSEPMKTAAAKLMPESCFWKNAVRKLEPHRCAAMGVGAAGVGF